MRYQMVCAIVLSQMVAELAEVLLQLRIDSELLADRVTGDLPHELVRPARVAVFVADVRDGLVVESFNLRGEIEGFSFWYKT
jgi:hypothetical protein